MLMHKRVDLIYSLLHLPVDIIAIVTAFIMSYWIRGNGNEIYRLPYPDYLNLVYSAVPIWVMIFILQGLYNKRNLFGTVQNLLKIAISVLAGWASFVVFLTFLRSEQTLVFPRLMLIYVLVLGFLFVFLGRLILRLVQTIARSVGIGRQRVMLFGSGKDAESLEKVFQHYGDIAINFIKRVDHAAPKELESELKKYNIDELIIDNKSIPDDQILEYIRVAQNCGAICHLVPNTFEVTASNLLFSTLAGIPLLTFRQTPLEGWGRIAKRVIDMVGSLVGIIVTSPIMLLTALIIKITNPGPMLIRQKRVGRNGKHFFIYKFRSMDAKLTKAVLQGKTEVEIFKEMGRDDLVKEYEEFKKVKNDPRITPVGRFIRKTRIDELPQLFNVLKGELSLVGPRPIRDFELDLYGNWRSYLLSIKPGLTGLWQVSGGNDITYDERVQLDIQYVQNWSLWQDFIIIVKTVAHILFGVSHGY